MCTTCGNGTCSGCDSIQIPYIKGLPGDSAYQIWLNAGNTGTVADYLLSLNGEDGDDGDSAYDTAVENGYAGTPDEWLASLRGKSAYQSAVDGGFVGSEAAWIASLDGADGDNAWNTLSAPFTMPAFDAIDVATFSTPPNWASVGQPVFITGLGTLRVASAVSGNTVQLMNPNVNWQLNTSDPLVQGVPGNAAAGTIAPIGSKMSPGGRPARGAQGVPGPTTTPTPGTPGADGLAGSQTFFLNGDPNLQPPTYGDIDDVVYDTSTMGSFKIWQKVGASTWNFQGTIEGANTSGVADEVFRVGKSSNQPIPIGLTTPIIIQFSDWTSAGLYNGGWWNGSMYQPVLGATTPQKFILENLRLYSAVAETITFQVDIEVKTVVEGTANVVIVADTEGLLAVLTTGNEVIDPAAITRVIITPLSAPAQQWYIDSANIVFYNQT